jgi:hypothetical protein
MAELSHQARRRDSEIAGRIPIFKQFAERRLKRERDKISSIAPRARPGERISVG